MRPLSEAVTAEVVEEFQKNGAVCLRQVFSESWIEAAASGIEQNLLSPSHYSEKLQGETGPGAYFNDYLNWKKIPEFQAYAQSSPAAEIAGRLTESEYIAFYHEHVLVKEPGTYRTTPWHQDQPYYPINGFKVCSIWMPIDPVLKDSSIQFVAGSHRWGKLFHPKKFATFSQYEILKTDETDITYEPVPDIDSNEDQHDILQWDLEPGDCIVFHMRTLHAAHGNISLNRPRRVLSTRWLGDDATMAARPWEPSPPTYGGLNIGERAVSDDFPIIWRRQ